jgi:hypothetical protein
MIDRLFQLVVDEGKWLTGSMGLAFLTTACWCRGTASSLSVAW